MALNIKDSETERFVRSHLAFQAYERFGKGRHAARLNIGDCAAYALAKARGWPLLYKGDDFSATDIERA